jgi:hypothetical protein
MDAELIKTVAASAVALRTELQQQLYGTGTGPDTASAWVAAAMPAIVMHEADEAAARRRGQLNEQLAAPEPPPGNLPGPVPFPELADVPLYPARGEPEYEPEDETGQETGHHGN